MLSTYFLIVAAVAGFYMAFNIGANDSANSMASAVGSRALTFRQAIIIASVVEFVGAYFVGSHVTQTIRKGVISPQGFASIQIFSTALLAAILGAAMWVFIATWKEMPVSTTHSIVGAIIGVGIVAGGVRVVSWDKVWQIVLSWVVSPLFSGIFSFFIFRMINAYFIIPDNREAVTKKHFPIFIFFTFFIVFMSVIFKTPVGNKLNLSVSSGIAYCILSSTLMMIIIGRIITVTVKDFHPETVFRYLQILTSSYLAFAHGANDVANAIGPISGIYSIYKTGTIAEHAEVPGFILAIGGIGISAGIILLGYKVMKTLGYRITELTNTRGFTIDFSAATTVLVASKMGLPVSTTHAVVGAIVGVGLARGLEALDMKVVRDIMYAWLLTLPAAAVFAAAIFYLIKMI
ncbi:MAG: inorganic phosphate transporter [Elusimicrobia bacterium]|nr:inorganic phosphate transporter [Elusimicrobiota bacterium]